MIGSLYRGAGRPLLFHSDAERAHDRAIRLAELCSGSRLLCSLARALRPRPDARLRVEIAGLPFEHPVGLAAGFDKNGRGLPFWAALGFSHIEVGSVSAESSAGNPKPRLFRIPEDQGIVVYYGLPNDGVDLIANRLSRVRAGAPVGVNIVNTNRGAGAPAESPDAVIADYAYSVSRSLPVADYLALNLSCPNTCDGRTFFSSPERLAALLDAVSDAAPSKPVFLKVAPFPGPAEMEAFLKVVERAPWVTGFEVNLPPGKPCPLRTSAGKLARMPGAVSGKPCQELIDATLREFYRRMDRRRYRLIGAGGIFTAADAYRKIRAGASLVQLLTGMVYRGPGVVAEVVNGLPPLLERDGLRGIGEAVGLDVSP